MDKKVATLLAMAAAKVARPLLFCGIVPRGVSTAEVGKALLKRFTLADVHGVQDFQSGQTEILFKHMKAVEKTLSESTLRIGEHTVRFSYRGSHEKIVRVSSYLMGSHASCVCAVGSPEPPFSSPPPGFGPGADEHQHLGLAGSCPCSERRLRSVLVVLWLWARGATCCDLCLCAKEHLPVLAALNCAWITAPGLGFNRITFGQ